ncbi:phosphotransferase family protein [Streptomyces sp. NBC_00481]|uniref:phosphotransferase family protein n=1 Tax=Streptomyces sp. NBC_00481 TaxID=2975755 RepID=UPI002DD998E6|nr:aminoglycoside phosphotransferase family protein [Streptomyces sp. NBC_00481]
MRTGRLLGSGRTADVYELHADEGESATEASVAVTGEGTAGALAVRDARDATDSPTEPGRRDVTGGPCGRAGVGGPGGPGGPGSRAGVGGPGGPGGPGSRAGVGGPGGPGGPGSRAGVGGPGGPGGPGSRAGVDGPGGPGGPGNRLGVDGPGRPDGPTAAWVLRRYRDGWGDAAAEAEVMEYVRSHGYPVPRVRSATRTEMVLERLSGPTMLEAFAGGLLDPAQTGATLARLLHALHALPPRDDDAPSALRDDDTPSTSPRDPVTRVLHLDLHPENVIVTPQGPQVIDWSTAEEGPPGLDWGISAMILAQVAVDSADFRAEMARATLVSLLAHQHDGPSALTEEGLVEARRRRAANPTMTVREVELIGVAEELIRSLTDPGPTA